MKALIFECPRTRCSIDAGIQMDKSTLAAVEAATLRLYCPHCLSSHELPIRCALVSEGCDPRALGESELPKTPALTIAINALRISWLKRGLGGHKG